LAYKSGNVDLHIHSTASDGSLKPSDILAFAQKIGLAAIALTDHDSIEGAREVLRNGVPQTIEFLSGVEISADPPKALNISGSLHILGYGIQLDDSIINTILQNQQDARKNRNPQIIAHLNALGFEMSLEEVIAISGKGQIGRPHIANVMVKKGFAASIDDAFDRYLGKGKPAYIDKPRIQTRTAIGMIHSAGGVAVLAHPGLIELPDSKQFDDLLHELISLGLNGIEVYYPGHTHSQTTYFTHLADKYHLLATGGTDFHGEISPDIGLGVGHGNFCVPYAVYERLLKEINRASSYR